MDDVLKAQLGILSRTAGPSSQPAVGLFLFSIFAPNPCVSRYEKNLHDFKDFDVEIIEEYTYLEKADDIRQFEQILS